jgi:hypothetical protein
MNLNHKLSLIIFVFLVSFLVFSFVYSAGMDSVYKYAWGENIGWVNFNPTHGNVDVSDTKITGYAWSENYGWINLAPTNGGVLNDGNGNLSGYAWGENLGWIDFSNVKIDPNTGEFSGYAVILKDGSKINFDCTNCKVKTEWRKTISTTTPPSPSLSSGGGAIIVPSRPPEKSLDIISKLKELLITLIEQSKEITKTPIKEISKIPFLEGSGPFSGKWRFLSYTLSNKPLREFISPSILKEFVFIKSIDESIDFNISLTVDEKGKPVLKANFITGKKFKFLIKPEKSAKSIKGYIVFKSKKSKQALFKIPAESLFFKATVLAESLEKSIPVEEKLVLVEFEYKDDDRDGIWKAEVQMPNVEGEYEIITVIDYEDVKRVIKLIAIVDPEGYVYEKYNDKEIRIHGAVVSLFWLNPETKKYELWPANEYNQENPQITDVSGGYAFLVPPGYYYLKVEAPGYLPYIGKPFYVKEGSGVHFNIELKSKYWVLKIIDWKTILLIMVVILLLYNFYRDKIREELLKKQQ